MAWSSSKDGLRLRGTRTPHEGANLHQPKPTSSLTSSPASSVEKQDTQTSTPNIDAYDSAAQSTLAADPSPSTTLASLQPVAPAAHLGPPQTITDVSNSPTLPGRLWAQAYNAIRRDEPKLVRAYEMVLRSELGGESTTANNDESDHQTGAEQTQAQMVRLVDAGLKKMRREAAVKDKIQEGMHVVSSVKELVGTAVKHAPEAAAAWAGVCLLLQVLENPIAKAGAHRNGVSYIISRMDWYWNISSSLLENQQESDGLRTELEKHIIALYKKLLLYQMGSICSFCRKPATVIWQDMFKFDNGIDAMQSVKDAEGVVQQDIDTYNKQEMRMSLNDMAELARDRNIQLQDIHRATQESLKKQEKRQQDDQDRKCLEDLRLSDPRDDRRRIHDMKGGLFHGASNWILAHDDFRRWRDDDEARLLWIKGDPGKGKTMLLVSIVEELERQLQRQSGQPTATVLSYFFCQGTVNNLNNATAVLRGLIYLLGHENPALISYLRERYDTSGAKLFEDGNAFSSLSHILENMLCDVSLSRAYIVIDALDECGTDLQRLLDFIARNTFTSPRVKWIVSSRNQPSIEQQLRLDDSGMKLSLELTRNADQVARAVSAYIDFKISQVQSLQDDTGERDQVRDIMCQKANATFLWVALVIQELENPETLDALQVVKEVPADLYGIYDRMMKQIRQLKNLELCWSVLSTVTLAYRPLHLAELSILSRLPRTVSGSITEVRSTVAMCSSFLTIQDGYVYHIHQSAKDYLVDKASNTILPSGPKVVHHAIFSRSLEAMSTTLRRNIYNLSHPGFPIGEIKAPDPDPLVGIQYSCVHWISHFCDVYNSPEDRLSTYDIDTINHFLQNDYLYWLEALGLIQNMGDAILSVTRLESLLREQSSNSALLDLVQGSRRFILQNRGLIENAPLQVYASALVFSPVSCLIRKIFEKEEPEWIRVKPVAENSWSPCLQTLEGHSSAVVSVAFSPDSKLIASGSCDKTAKIWDTATGSSRQILQGHFSAVVSIAFSPDSNIIVSGSGDKTIKIWDTATGSLRETLEGHGSAVMSVVFSPDSKLIASGSHDKTVKIWDAATGSVQQTLKGHGDFVWSVAFSPDFKLIASGSHDKTVKIWDAATGSLRQTLEGHVSGVWSVAFSPNSRLVGSGSGDKTVKIWDVATGSIQQTLEGHGDFVWSVAFSPDSKLVASGSHDKTVKIWDAVTGSLQRTLEGHGDPVGSVAFSSDYKLVASGSDDKTIKIWDATARSL